MTSLFGVDFCPQPTFEDEFDGTKLSSMWKPSSYSFSESASFFSPTNVRVEDGYLILTLNNVGTTDEKGRIYIATSGEVVSTQEFGYGRYEFRVLISGLTPVTEAVQLLWDGGDYSKHHEYIGFDFQERGFLSLLSVGITKRDEFNVFHSAGTDDSQQPVPLNLKFHFFTIEYLPDSITWYYDLENIVRQEVSAVKKLPTHKMRVTMRNWLIDKLKYSLESSDMPVEFKIDYFKFTPIDDGKGSCQKVSLEDESKKEANSSSLDEKVTVSLSELEKVIENLPEGENNLIGYSGEITNFSIFKSAKVVWIYVDGEWQGYSPYRKVRETLEKNNITIFDKIPPYTGFWIQK